jgi:hypothetical protein
MKNTARSMFCNTIKTKDNILDNPIKVPKTTFRFKFNLSLEKTGANDRAGCTLGLLICLF